jgi:hypothetical protein
MKNNRTLIIILALGVLGVIAFMLLKEPAAPADQTGNNDTDTLQRVPTTPPTCPCDSVVITQTLKHTKPDPNRDLYIVEVWDTVTCSGAPWVDKGVKIVSPKFTVNLRTDRTGAAYHKETIRAANPAGDNVTSSVVCTGDNGIAETKTATGAVPALP